MKYLIALLLFTGCSEKKLCNVYWITPFDTRLVEENKDCKLIRRKESACGYSLYPESNVRVHCISPYSVQEVLNDVE